VRQERTAAIKLLNKNEQAVDVTLVDFHTEVRVARYGAENYPQLIERIRMRKLGAYTALYDACRRAWRPVEINLTRRDLKGARIRTRPGYYAPSAPRSPSPPGLEPVALLTSIIRADGQ
jgi:hypothetical protein